MRHWLWIPVVLATGCFSEPAEPSASGGTEAEGSTGPATTEGGGSTSGASSISGVGSTDPTNGTDDTDDTNPSSTTTDTPGSSSTTDSGPACGDGVVEGDEQCDGDDPQGAACLDDCTITCLDDFQDCDEMPVGGCEIDTATDGNNCGACGHTCASGVCEGSQCAPVAIAQGIGQGPMRIIRVGDTFVFDESGFGAIFRWDLGQDEAEVLVSDDLTGSFGRIAVANDSVVWLDGNQGAAQRVSLDGGAVDFMFAIEEAGSPFASATHVYYPTTEQVELQQVSTLLRATHEAPDVTVAVASDISGLMCQVVEAAGRIVWTGTDFENPVGSIPAGGGAPQFHPVLSTDACNRPVYAVGASIYLYGHVQPAGPFGIISHNISTGASFMLVQENGFGTLGDYFVSEDGILADVDGEVRAYNLQGNEAVTVAEASLNTRGHYLDDEVVMWTELEDNTWTLLLNDRP